MWKMVAVGVLLAGLPFVSAQDTKVKTDETVVHSKLSEGKKSCGAACTVNFAKDLGVGFDYLGSLGHRISVARKAPDPVELAMAAQSLAVAEKIAGKKASITAEQVQKEALELAKMRGISSELSALAMVITDPTTQKELQKDAAIAKKRETDAKAKLNEKTDDKELFGTLRVINHSGECLRIYVSGRCVGEVHEGEVGQFRVHDHNDPTHLTAYCEDGDLVGHTRVYGHRHNFTWDIHQ